MAPALEIGKWDDEGHPFIWDQTMSERQQHHGRNVRKPEKHGGESRRKGKGNE
jgi:hypothetical protein